MNEVLSKLEVARRQLGAALALYLDDKDSVSVHVLACGGGEIAHRLAESAGGEPFALHALKTFPEIDQQELGKLRNKYWNPFKHASSRDGRDRNDDTLLAQFSDEANDHHLFIAWYDFAIAAKQLPIEAQIFQVWYFAKHPHKLRDGVEISDFTDIFPGILEFDRSCQKARLRLVINQYRLDQDLMSDPMTDSRPLLLGLIQAT